jgi:hypothetical protein
MRECSIWAFAQSGQGVLISNCAHELARKVWPKLAGSVRIKPVNMNWPNASESALRDESRRELRPLSRGKAGVAGRIKQLCAPPERQKRVREQGLCEDLTRAASMKERRVKGKSYQVLNSMCLWYPSGLDRCNSSAEIRPCPLVGF